MISLDPLVKTPSPFITSLPALPLIIDFPVPPIITSSNSVPLENSSWIVFPVAKSCVEKLSVSVTSNSSLSANSKISIPSRVSVPSVPTLSVTVNVPSLLEVIV